MKYWMIIGLAICVTAPAFAYDSGNVSRALGLSSRSAQTASGYRSRGIRGANFYKRGNHVSSVGKGGKVVHCSNCRGRTRIKYKTVYTNPNPPLPSGNWRHGHGPNYRTSRR